jgi:hypothetical protein
VIKIAGMWELGWNTPIREIDIWEVVVREFNVDQFYMTPISGIRSNIVTERKSIDDVLEENQDITKVFVDVKAETSLNDFDHPKDAIYVFGKAGRSPLYDKKENDLTLRVNTPNNTELLWPYHICSIILYDRFLKNGNSN